MMSINVYEFSQVVAGESHNQRHLSVGNTMATAELWKHVALV